MHIFLRGLLAIPIKILKLILSELSVISIRKDRINLNFYNEN